MDFIEERDFYTDILLKKYEKIMLTKKETAKELGVGEATVDRIRKQPKGIKSKKILGQIMFPINEVARYLAEL